MSPARRETVALAKAFGILFAAVSVFYVGYFLWSFFNEATIFQLIQRGTSILIFSFITYTIHADIRSRVRYGRDEPLYKAVSKVMENDVIAQAVEAELRRHELKEAHDPLRKIDEEPRLKKFEL